MKISEILTESLRDKKVIADVEYYDSIVCLTKYSKAETVTIKEVEFFGKDNVIRGVITGGELDGMICNFPISEDTEFNFL